jgi:general secretion pathway protein L
LLQSNRLADALGASLPPWRWITARLDDAAEVFATFGWVRPRRRRLVFIEQANGTFVGPAGGCRIKDGCWVFTGAATKLRGTEIEFRLSAERCMFRELELPAGAGPFLDGVVRAQLDRLTPWRTDEAAFGWNAAPGESADRLRITVAATKRQPIAALLEISAEFIIVTTDRQDGTAPIEILSRRSGALARRARWRGALAAALAVSLVAGLAALVAEATLGAHWQEEIDSQTAVLARGRAALLRREHAADDPASRELDARKRATPAAVVTLEALSRAIPDEAYLTQLRLTGDKIEIAGVGANAALLIRHIEQSPYFSHATFSAPTTRGADDRESFRIAAHVAPLNTTSP